MKNKTKHYERHARDRALQRFGATGEELDALRERIKAGKLQPVFKESEARRHYNAELNGKPAIIVWDRNRGCIITVLERLDGNPGQTRQGTEAQVSELWRT